MAAILSLGVQGCASSQAAAFDALRLALSRGGANADPASQRLNPQYRYLRLTVNGQPTLLVLGYVDQADSSAPVQVWYSGAGEVIRLRHGRLAGLVGTPTEWRDVRWPQGVPSWQGTLQRPSASYQRSLDQMPGYRLGVVQSLRLEALAKPGNTAWAGTMPADLRWFQESASAGPYAPVRYAVRFGPQGAEPVYGEQCLTPDLCLTWQTWPMDQEPRS
ncbi:MAG: YjbF family lipoprotein [Pseudomonadota bacterium]